MNNKTLFLIAGIITSLVFIGYLAETEPHNMFGYSINIWFVRLAWFMIAVLNFINYFKLKKAEQK